MLQEKPLKGGHWWVSERPQAETWGDTIECQSGRSSGTWVMLLWLAQPRGSDWSREKVAVHRT